MTCRDSTFAEDSDMAAQRKRSDIDLREVYLRILRASDPKDVVQALIAEFGIDGLIANMTPAHRREILKRIKAEEATS